ncbi:sugar transferase [Chamaesiphon sp. VAR_48_metabat_135_sub]|uniref:sugar transferase n=1 Tax=Chamaesiphon sp. VAR_48_metabat_135_sub TaxID=2964699 RepID=UPI00286B3422|nr:sugar transferase [Chamaesiphon sp. VAR_48_metabat_135_sub]
MTDRQTSDITSSARQTEDIRARNLSIRWWTLINGLKSLFLVGLDASMLFASWTIADRLGTPTAGVHITNSMIPILAVGIGTLAASGFYGTDDKLHRFANLFKSLALAQLIEFIAAFFYQPGIWVSRSVFAIALILNFLSISGARFLFDLFIIQIRKRNPIFQQAIVLVGNQMDIEHVRKLLKRSRQFRIDSIIDLSIWDIQRQLDEIIDQIKSRKISEVFICSPQLIDNQIILFWNLKAAGIHLRMVPTEIQLPERSAETKMIEEIPTVRFKSLPIFGFNFWLKRVLDLIAASAILLVISPILLLVAFLIKKTSSGPIFYKQYRVGLKGRRFQVWKFRTMVENATELQKELEQQNEVKGGVLFKIKDDPRITSIGKFLRDYSIDELPQLINVLQGEMSLVGPRPLPIRDYELSIQNIEQFSRDRFLRYEVLPGITGLWQVKGRATIDSDEIFYWDMVYILQWSLTLDLKILLQTIKVVLFKEGSY